MKRETNRVLISVTDKTGLRDFASGLSSLGFEIFSTGGTLRFLQEHGIQAKSIEALTQFSEILDGRVKTLHPKIHAGILALKDKKAHMKELNDLHIQSIDLVVVNLYPFQKAIQKKDVTLEEVIENIDVGGSTLIRSAAKNHERVGVITGPEQYHAVLEELQQHNGGLSMETRRVLAAKAFEHTASYDAVICNYFHEKYLDTEVFPQKIVLSLEKQKELRYGENPNLRGALYKISGSNGTSIADAEQLNGIPLSFNNYNDASTAFEIAREFSEPCAVIIKHANPCGIALGKTIEEAFEKALECDKRSSFGGIIALNRQCNLATAEKIVSFFNEIVIAPDFEKSALEKLVEKRKLRVLKMPGFEKQNSNSLELKMIHSAVLVQETNNLVLEKKDLELVSKRFPSEQELSDMLFAERVVKHVKSNSVVIAKEHAAIGISAGQTSRIDAVLIAIGKSGERSKNAVLASDAFFPFKDSVLEATKAGITAIIEPGGSIRDQEVIEAADANNIALAFSGVRRFRH